MTLIIHLEMVYKKLVKLCSYFDSSPSDADSILRENLALKREIEILGGEVASRDRMISDLTEFG